MENTIKEILLSENWRNKVIVSSIYIEELLETLLKKFFIKGTDEKIFTRGILSNFNNKIELSYRLGLISESDHDFLNIVRNIRNKCAHRIGEGKDFDITFAETEIIETMREVIPKKDLKKESNKNMKEKGMYFREKIIDQSTVPVLFSYLILVLSDRLKYNTKKTRKRRKNKPSFPLPYIQHYFTLEELLKITKISNNSLHRTVPAASGVGPSR